MIELNFENTTLLLAVFLLGFVAVMATAVYNRLAKVNLAYMERLIKAVERLCFPPMQAPSVEQQVNNIENWLKEGSQPHPEGMVKIWVTPEELEELDKKWAKEFKQKNRIPNVDDTIAQPGPYRPTTDVITPPPGGKESSKPAKAPRKSSAYTPEEDDIIRQHWGKMSAGEIAEKFFPHKTSAAINQRAKKGLKLKPKYTRKSKKPSAPPSPGPSAPSAQHTPSPNGEGRDEVIEETAPASPPITHNPKPKTTSAHLSDNDFIKHESRQPKRFAHLPPGDKLIPIPGGELMVSTDAFMDFIKRKNAIKQERSYIWDQENNGHIIRTPGKEDLWLNDKQLNEYVLKQSN